MKENTEEVLAILRENLGGDDDAKAFESKLEKGLGAGSHKRDGVLACTTGQDCSGFVGRVWGAAKKYSTSTIHQISKPIDFDDLQPGQRCARAHSARASSIFAFSSS